MVSHSAARVTASAFVKNLHRLFCPPQETVTAAPDAATCKNLRRRRLSLRIGLS
jgi:hypothetical protein